MGSTLASRSMGGHGSAKVGIHCLSLHSLAFGQIPKAVTPDMTMTHDGTNADNGPPTIQP